jgi:hypothetical protein
VLSTKIFGSFSFVFFLILFPLLISCQKDLVKSIPDVDTDISAYVGYWSGDLRYDNYHLPLAFDIEEDQVIFHNPVQSSIAVPMDSTTYDADLKAYISHLIFTFSVKADDELWVDLQEGEDIKRFVIYRDRQISPPDRPQHPTDTIYPYTSTDVSFDNVEASIRLSGTLTIPDSNLEAMVILLTGSGPQDRDETLLHHKPFAVIADFLSTHGMGVLRYDDRGIGGSEGVHMQATSYDFAQDAEAAYLWIKDKFPDQPIGFLGHSEGAMIAQIADSLVMGADFHIYLAGPGLDVINLMLAQNRQVLTSSFSPEALDQYISQLGPIFEIVSSADELSAKQDTLNRLTKSLYESLPPEDATKLAPSSMVYSMSINQLLYLKWWPYFLGYHPKRYLSQISCPILALNGSRDIQVTPDNLAAIETYAIHAEVTTVTLEGHNHLFQMCDTCNLREYGLITQTISHETLSHIKDWLISYGWMHK